jgi:hypothetical protein
MNRRSAAVSDDKAQTSFLSPNIAVHSIWKTCFALKLTRRQRPFGR